jgi:hypothetical protein
MSGNFRKRLQRLEKMMAEISKPEPKGQCNCREFTWSATAEHFASEMNQTCPVHGFRSLGKLKLVRVTIGRADSGEDKSVGLKEVVAEYRRRLVRHRQEKLEEAIKGKK